MLGTILGSHSKIAVVEEKPALHNTKSFLAENGYYNFTKQLIEPKQLAKAREIYDFEFKKHISGVTRNLVFIDKLPLNLLHLPLIQQLYPDAKFILALRHPLDAILSCWMQNFDLNNEMAIMLDLNQTVNFYCRAMEILKISKRIYKLNVHEIRYEDLINNFQLEVDAVLNFLNLSWEPELENYQDKAIKRGRINTPSYSQVVQPIYKDSQYRWLNYQKYLVQYLEQTKPWISEYGYG